MKEISSDYIKKVIEIMQNNELTEVVIEDKEKSLLIKGSGYKPVVKERLADIQEVAAEEVVPDVDVHEKNKNVIPIVSNMIGLFYSKPSPSEKPFVSVGDTIKEGQIICIIETIKLMNKITSDVSGKVVEICIEDGKPVEYGQVIMYIEKN